MTSVDLNADLGERSAGQPIDSDRALLGLVTSASIACGGHAGDEVVMRETVELALARSVVIGAHPSYPDRANFGRVETGATPSQIFDLVRDQVRALERISGEVGARLRFVKPHGALYNRAVHDDDAADAIAASVAAISPKLLILAPSGSAMEQSAARFGLVSVSEAFPDRAYTPAGSLSPRGQPGAVIDDPVAVARRAVQMVESSTVVATDGATIRIGADSLCIHGDGPRAVESARAVRFALESRGVILQAFGA